MKITLFADSRYRDSFGLAATKYWLNKLSPNAEVFVTSFDLWQHNLSLVKPDVVVLNHAFGARNEAILRWANQNGATSYLMFTEGRPNTEEQVEWYLSQRGKADYVLAWSSWLGDMFDNAIVTGCPRFDIYQYPYNKLIEPRQFVLDKYGLNPHKGTLLVTTSFPQAKFSYQGVSFNEQDWKDLKVTSISDRKNPTEFAKQEKRAQHLFKTQLTGYVEASTVSDWNIVIKPQPMSPAKEWERYCDENSFTLAPADYVFNALSAADFVINRAGCLTTQDAWLAVIGKPVIQLNPNNQELTGSSLEAFGIDSDEIDKKRKFLNKYGFSFQNSSRKVAETILETAKPANVDRSIVDRIKWQKAQTEYDNSHVYPDLSSMHPVKAITSNVIKNWETKIAEVLS